MSPGPADDFLPAARPPDRVARRRARQTRQWAILGGVVATAVVVAVLIAVLGGDDGSSARDSSPRGAHRRVATTSTRGPRLTTTTSVADGETATSSTPPGSDTGSGSGGSAPPTTASPDTTPAPVEPDGGVTVTEDGGACAFDATTEELVDAGMLQNSGPEEAVAEVQVTWSDDTGELDSWTDVQSIPSGGSTAWSVATAWPEPVQGRLRCEIALI